MAYHARGVGEYCNVNIFQNTCTVIEIYACKVWINFQMEESGRHFENLPTTGTLLIKTKLFVLFVFLSVTTCQVVLWVCGKVIMCLFLEKYTYPILKFVCKVQ